MQEYLAETYRIASYQDEPFVSTSALADAVGVTAPAVARMATRLKDAGYVEHAPYHGMRLTQLGEHEALKSIRRHRLAEIFLVKVMGFRWHEVHDGEPIPSADFVMPVIKDFPLTDLEPEVDLVISRVHTHDPELLMYLEELHLMPGQLITLVSRAPFNGPLRLRVGRNEQVIGSELGNVLRVEFATADITV